MGIRIFSLQEVNEMLPDLAARIEGLRDLHRRLVRERDRVAVLDLIGGGVPGSAEHDEYLEHVRETTDLASEFDAGYRRIRDLGCLVKDLNRGLLDFYAVKDGRLIFFCWELGEREVRFWHELNSGYAGRKPIGELHG